MEGAGEMKVWKKELEDERCRLPEVMVHKAGPVEESGSQVCVVVEGGRGSFRWGPWKMLRPCNSCCHGFAAEV